MICLAVMSACSSITPRGSVIGSPVAPLNKGIGNRQTDARMIDEMGINAGRVLEGEATLDEQLLGDAARATVQHPDQAHGQPDPTQRSGAIRVACASRDSSEPCSPSR
jgi:hypothetical protein